MKTGGEIKMLKPKYKLNDFVRYTGLRRNERRFRYQFIEDFKKQQLEGTAKIVGISYRTDFNIFEYEVSYPFANKEKTYFVREFDLLKRKNQNYYNEKNNSHQST
jgi:hypothetical protein